MSKNISKNLSTKYSQKLLDHAKESATDALNPILGRPFWGCSGMVVVVVGGEVGKKTPTLKSVTHIL